MKNKKFYLISNQGALVKYVQFLMKKSFYYNYKMN